MDVQQFGPYELEAMVGIGGMGEVYRAHDMRHDREVALKLLPEALSGDHEFVRRFQRESHVAARLREPHVIPIHDYGEIDGRLFIDMRLVDGQNMQTLLDEQGPLAPSRAVYLVGQIAEALDAAHADGLVHRDIKPSNILVTKNDFVYVVDFGIARALGVSGTSLTVTGTTVGTLDYMAPERFENRPVDGRVDVYALSCLLYQCLTGARPFSGEDLPSLLYAHLYTPPPKPSERNPAVTAAMDAVITRGMAKKPDDRFATAGEFAQAARRALGDTTEVGLPGTPVTRHTADQREPGAPGEPAVRRATAASPTGNGETTVHGAPRPVGTPGENSVRQPPQDADFRSADRLASAPPTVSEPVGAEPPRTPPSKTPEPPRTPEVSPAEPPGPHRRRSLLVALVAVAAALAVVAVVALIRGGFGRAPDDGGTAPAAPEAASTAPAASIAVPTVGAAVPVGTTPGFIAVAPNGLFAYIANRNAGVVTVFDTTINAVTATIPVSPAPQFIAFTRNGERAYVSAHNQERTVNVVMVLDTATNKVLTTVPVAKRPFALELTPDQRFVYVPSHDTGTIDVIDTATNKLVSSVRVAPNPHWVAFSSDGRYAYVANHESNVLSVLDTATNTVITTIRVGTSPHSVAVSPDGQRVSVVNFDSSTVSVIDTATNKVVATLRVGANPQDITYAPDGRYFYTTNVDANTVSVVDTATNQVTATIPVGDAPTSVAVLPNGRHAYVTNLKSATLTVLNTAR